MSKYYIGVDPGQKGAIAVIDSNSNPVALFSAEGSYLDRAEQFEQYYYSILDKEHPANLGLFCALERVWAHRGQGISSGCKFCREAGFWEGFFKGLAFVHKPIETPIPQKWQNQILGQTTGKNKYITVMHIWNNYPQFRPWFLDARGNQKPLKKHDGIADSICLALYAQSVYGNLQISKNYSKTILQILEAYVKT